MYQYVYVCISVYIYIHISYIYRQLQFPDLLFFFQKAGQLVSLGQVPRAPRVQTGAPLRLEWDFTTFTEDRMVGFVGFFTQ